MDRLSFYASKGTPFFFVIDYKKEQIFVEKLNNLKNILFHFPHIQNFSPKKASAAIIHKEPISFERYKRAFDIVQEEIKRGNTYLLNLTFPTKITLQGSLLDAFYASFAPFKLYFLDRFVCFSPERFIKIEGSTISTFPMKGTIDAKIPYAKEIILNDTKEMAEHTMIVDLLRNDLGQIARNVNVKKFRYIDKIKAGEKELLQVSSHIEATLPSNWTKNLGEIFDKLLPAGSISGTPKKSTLKIIERVENYERGFYTGIFGLFDGKNLDSAVMIRFLEDGIYKSGGGITIDSNPYKEYEELIQKVYLPI